MNDTTPRLGKLQWVGPALVGFLTLTVGLSQPALWWDPTSATSASQIPLIPDKAELLTGIIYLPLLTGLAAALVGSFRTIAIASHRQEFEALMGLGASRCSLVRHQARLGLTHGTVATLAGAVTGAGITQIRGGFGPEFNSATLWALLTTMGAGMISTLVAYWVAGRWVTRDGGGRAAVGPATGPIAASSTARPRRKALAVVGGLAAFAIFSALALPHIASGPTGPSGIVFAWMIADTFVLLAGVPVVLTWSGAQAGAWLSRLAGRALLRGGTAARIAGDGLTRPTPARAVAIGGVGLVLGATLGIGLMVNAVDARNGAGDALTPDATISTTDLPDRYVGTDVEAAINGWEPAALAPSLVAALEGDPRVSVVSAAMLTASVTAADGGDFGPTTYLAIDPTDLDRVSPGAPRALYFGGAVAMGGGPNPGTLSVGKASATAAAPHVGGPFTAIPRDWAQRTFGQGATSAVLLYMSDGVDAQAVLADYDVDGLYVHFRTPSGVAYNGLPRAATLAVAGSLLILAVGLVVSLSLSVQRMRGHDFATMSALGATNGALRWATAIESAVVTASGAFMGLVAGAAWGLANALIGDGIPARLAWHGARFDLRHGPWGTVGLLALAAILAAAVASVLARSRLERLTPAQQLREAIKEGPL